MNPTVKLFPPQERVWVRRKGLRATKTLTTKYNLNYFASLRKRALRVGEMAQQAKHLLHMHEEQMFRSSTPTFKKQNKNRHGNERL